MIEKVLEKITAEQNENAENAYVKTIGDYLITLVKDNPEHAINVIDESKTVLGSLKFMKEKARAKAKGGMAMFTPDEGYEIVKEYFGIKDAPKLRLVKNHLDISLDDLL